jgi:hypothetical protein
MYAHVPSADLDRLGCQADLPRALGKPTSVVWREIWQDIGPMLSQARGGPEGT